MKQLYLLTFIFIYSFSFSQNIIFDNLNPNGGVVSDENINISFTIGQPIVGTISNSSFNIFEN